MTTAAISPPTTGIGDAVFVQESDTRDDHPADDQHDDRHHQRQDDVDIELHLFPPGTRRRTRLIIAVASLSRPRSVPARLPR